jgi:N-acetylglucosaminyl-diphospho-decaprenol L-rhamnosyltransferase
MPVRTVLIDNASTDDTVAWTKREHPEVEVVELPRNIGYDAAREHALEHSSSKYTMFLDSDAALTPGALPAMVAALDANPGWGLIGPRLAYDDGTLQRSCRRFPPLALPLLRRPPLARIFEDRPAVSTHLMKDFAHDQTRPVLYVIGACNLFRTELARQHGRADTWVPAGWAIGWADAEWCFRIRDAGGEIMFFPEVTVIHRYRRATTRKPVSGAALRQLRYFVDFQWKYKRRRREFIRLSRELDRRASEQESRASSPDPR